MFRLKCGNFIRCYCKSNISFKELRCNLVHNFGANRLLLSLLVKLPLISVVYNNLLFLVWKKPYLVYIERTCHTAHYVYVSWPFRGLRPIYYTRKSSKKRVKVIKYKEVKRSQNHFLTTDTMLAQVASRFVLNVRL